MKATRRSTFKRFPLPALAAAALVVVLAAVGTGPAFSGGDSGAIPHTTRATPLPWTLGALVYTPGGGQAVLVQAPTAGQYMLITGPALQIWYVTPSGDVPPGPGPTPPVPPAPVVDAEKAAYDAGMKLPADAKTDAPKMAAIYSEVSKQIGDKVATTDALIKATRLAREMILGERSKAWDPWATEVGAWIDKQRAAGALKAIADYKPVWEGIATGLGKVK